MTESTSNDAEPTVPLAKIFAENFARPRFMAKMSAPQLLAQQQAFNEVKFCATKSCAETKFQWCHAIAESAQLGGIAESGNCCWLPMQERDRWTLSSWWTEDTTSRVLVFRGFCNPRDSSIFKPIDAPLQLSPEVYLLLAYRASCYWNWRANVDLRSLELLPDKLSEAVAKDTELPRLTGDPALAIKPLIDAENDHCNRVAQVMTNVREAVDNADYNFLETMTLDFGQDLPFRFSLAASFATSLRNEPVTISQKECPPMPAVFFHMLDVGGTTKLILSWPKYVPDRYPNEWLTQLIQYSESGHLADLIWRFMFINNHGLAFRPSFVPELNNEQCAFLTAPLATAFYHNVRPQVTRIAEPPYFATPWKLRQLQ